MPEEFDFWKGYNEHYQFSLREMEKARDKLLVASIATALLTLGGVSLEKVDIAGVSFKDFNTVAIVLILALITLGLLIEYLGQMMRAFLVASALDDSPFAQGLLKVVQARLGTDGLTRLSKWATRIGVVGIYNMGVPPIIALVAIGSAAVFAVRKLFF
jgi:hypothetical protein